MTISEQHHQGYRSDIDGLRAIAILLVVAFHAFPSLCPGGFVGVDLFFVISGFLISGIIFGQLEAGEFSFRQFYARRIRRIFPALILVMAACFVFGWFALLADEYRQLGKHLAGGAGFISNFLFWQESGYFDHAADVKPLLHLWSLGIEEQFYLIWPVLLWAAHRKGLHRLAMCMALVGISFALNIVSVHGNPVATFYSPATRFWELLIGAVLAYFGSAKAAIAPGSRLGRLAGRLRDLASFAGFAMLATAVLRLTSEHAFPGWWAALPTSGAFLILAAGPGAWLNRTLLSNRLLVWIGLISYPLYLWHWPLLVFARLAEYNAQSVSWQLRAAAVLLAIALAWITYLLVERPLRFGRHGAMKIGGLCALMLATGYAGYHSYRHDGLPFREANAKVALFAGILSPVETRIANDSCQRLFGRAPVPGAVCLARTGRPDMLIMGDSHAMAFNSAAYMGQAPLKTVMLASHGCLPFLSYQNYAPQDNRNGKRCFDVTREALALAGSNESIRTVVLVSRGPLYFSGRGFGMEENDVRFKGWTIEPLQPMPPMSNQDAFVNGYVEVSKQLVALGKTVVFAIDVPEFGINPEVCIANRPVAFRNQALPSCIISRALVDQRQSEYRALVKRIQAQVPALRVYDSGAVFCDAAQCASKDGSQVYFYDNNHVNLSGSAKLLTDLAAWLARLSGPVSDAGNGALIVEPALEQIASVVVRPQYAVDRRVR